MFKVGDLVITNYGHIGKIIDIKLDNHIDHQIIVKYPDMKEPGSFTLDGKLYSTRDLPAIRKLSKLEKAMR